MAVDTPAKIAVLGGGPIGLETALYARFLGYDVAIYERRQVGANVLDWGHARMFSPFALNRSTLGLAALAAQDPLYRPPGDDDLLTGRQWCQQYLLPLSQSDLLADQLHEQTTVLAIGRVGAVKDDPLDAPQRTELPFRILVRDPQGQERFDETDVVIDTTGVYGNANWIGPGGLPALHENANRQHIEYALPDVLGADRQRYAGKHTLLIGCGHSAATSVTALAELATQAAGTRITWITRRETDGEGPIGTIDQDRLPERMRLTQAANRCVHTPNSPVTHWAGTMVEAVRFDPASDRFVVQLVGQHACSATFDRIIANVGYRPDHQIYEELQVHQCYATGGPMRLAAALLGESSADCLEQKSFGPPSLLNPEPDFYILGAKSYGRNSNFLISQGLEQIRDLFTILGDRADLDLYARMTNLLP